jgi:ribosomal protein S18 acetylase RimI-like enzyme
MRLMSFASISNLSPGIADRVSTESWPRRMLRALARAALGDYGLYRIYSVDLARAPEPSPSTWAMAPVGDPEEFSRSAEPSLRALAMYAGDGACAFGTWIDGRLVAGCWFWAGELYRRRNFWPLSPGEAKLIQVTTAEEFRGHGIASALISFAAAQMKSRGYKRLFARVWHSHTASLAAFRRAGWTEEAFVAEVFPFRSRRGFRLVRRRKRR